MILEELIALLGFETKGQENLRRFQNDLDGAKKRLDSFAKGAAEVGRKVAMGMAAIGTAAVGAATAMFKLANDAAAPLDAMVKSADRAGVAFDSMQKLSYALEQSGGSATEMQGVLEGLSQRLGEAARGTGRARQALEDFGITATDAEGNVKRADAFLAELADKFQTLEESQINDLASKLGLSQATITMLKSGNAEMAALAEQFDALGLGFSEEEARRAEKYGDQVNRLSKAMTTLRHAIGVEAMPFLMKWMDGLETWYKANQAIIRQNLAHVMSGIGRGVDTVGQFALSAGKSIRWLSEQIEELTGIGAKGQAGLLGAGAVAWLASRHPVLAALAAAFLILDDYRAYLEDEDSLIGDFFAALDKVDARLDEARARQNALLAEQGKPPLLDLTWIEQAIQQLRSWDEALQAIIGPPPEILMPRLEWNIPDALAPIWRQFESWWNRLSEGFYNAGANSINAFLDGLKSIGSGIADFLNSLIPDWFRDLAGMQAERDTAANAGRTVGAMVQPAEPQRRDRVAPREEGIRQRAEQNARDLGFAVDTPELRVSPEIELDRPAPQRFAPDVEWVQPAPQRFAPEVKVEPLFDLTGIQQALRGMADTIRDWLQETLDGIDMNMVPVPAGGPQGTFQNAIDRRIDRAHDMPAHNTENPALAASIAAMAEKLQAITGDKALEQYVSNVANDARSYTNNLTMNNSTVINAPNANPQAIGSAVGSSVRNAGRDVGRSLAVTGNSGGAGR